VALIGTQCKAQEGQPVISYISGRHRVFSWGWRRCKFSNKSAGVLIAIGPRLKGAVREISSPPGVLAGRAGAIRLRNKTKDLLLVLGYFPPQGTPAAQETSQALLRWMDKVLECAPKRTIPVVLTDLNDQFGLTQDSYGNWYVDPVSRWVGPFARGQMKDTAHLMLDWSGPMRLIALEGTAARGCPIKQSDVATLLHCCRRVWLANA